MGHTTAIEWCDATFNPWIGCSKVSPGCDHCYAERDFDHRRHVVTWGSGQPRKRTSKANWQLPLRWQREAAAFQAEHGRRRRVFCASLADVFDNEVSAEWRADLFDLIANTPNLIWLILTKRIGNAEEMMNRALQDDGPTWPWENLWIGATIVGQAEADRDIPKLLATPAARRFLSIEPMLGPIDLGRIVLHSGPIELAADAPPEWRGIKTVDVVVNCLKPGTKSGRKAVDWVIVGGESGPQARPMHPDWVRSIRNQCAAAGVPFLFKQWGEWTPGENVDRQRGTVDTAFLDSVGWSIRPLNLATDHGHIDDQPDLYRVGKKAAGRLLDGVEHNGVPS